MAWLVGRLLALLLDLLEICMVGWLLGWLVGRLVGNLVDWYHSHNLAIASHPKEGYHALNLANVIRTI